jgi:hypothetical protein
MPSLARAIHLLLIALVTLGLLGFAVWARSWGAIVLLVTAGIGWAWYRRQVARSTEVEKFFEDAGEDTRLTGFGAVSPSELPPSRAAEDLRKLH